MANSNGWGDGAANNAIGWGQGANNAIAWGDIHADSWSGATDIVGFDSSAISYFNATGITGATQQDAIDNLVKDLKSYGIWSKMKAVYPFVTDIKNILDYSEDFNNAYWSKVNATVSSNATTAPDGTNTADLFTSTSTYGRFRTNNVPRNQSATYTFSCYIKGVSGVASIGSIVVGVGVGFTIASNGTVTVNAPVGISSAQNLQVSNVGNGWYRVSGTRVYTTSSDDFQIWSSNSGDTFYVWGAQLEIASDVTSYQRILTTQQAFISSQFKYNLVNPVDSDAAFRLVFNGGWTHSSNGATPNGTNGYADTKLNENTVMTLNNIHISFYSRTNSTAASCDIGCLDASTAYGTHIIPYSSGNAAVRNTDLASGFTAPANTLGLFVNSRISSSQTKYFYNASLFNTIVSPSLSKSNQVYFLSARNTGGSASLFSTKQLAFSTIGDGLTDTEASNLYTIVQNYQVALSRNV
jgi:hypothetical protein